MAKNEKAIYAPGELSQVRKKLGVTDDTEAKRMAKLLGGEVGVERNPETETKSMPSKKAVSRDGPAGNQRPKHRVELAFDEAELIKGVSVRRPADPADDPLIPVKASYFERVKMDRFCALPEFKIKSAGQAFMIMLPFFGDPPDLVNPQFINKKLNIYYKTMERLVTSVRILFPRNNTNRNEKLKRASPFACSVLDVLRYWNIEKIASDIAKVQAHPRNVRITELSDILKNIYGPLFVLERLELDEHIKESFKMLYKVLYLENPMDAKKKHQDLISEAIAAFNDVRRDLHYYLYPLLMKLLSDCYLPYEVFFSARRNRFMNFIGASESDQINPVNMAAELKGGTGRAAPDDEDDGQEEQQGQTENDGESKEQIFDDSEQIEREEKNAAEEKERKAMLQGVASLEALFPRAGWERLSSFPDIYPYFRDIYDLKRGYELIAPTDPLLQTVVIMRILEDMLLGLRNVHFGTVVSSAGGPVRVDETLNSIISNWQSYINIAVEKEYLSRLIEYCRIIDQSESRASAYAKRLFCEIHWVKRLFFLPYYKFDSTFPPPVQKKNIEQVYPAVRSFRRGLTLVAAGIEQANRIGGADKMVPCDGIDNPWEAYNFAIPNPVSTRLDTLLPAKRRNNATLVFFSLAFSTVLDHLLNDENSWAYRERQSMPFRTVNGLPQFGVDEKIDTEAIFKESIRQREEAGE
ncbi:MAG: hypothetical protein LBP20_04975 [Treponema sp.]|jgi:hypothetical protein|nr:hypothetical protein [Treponema sp.]